MKKPNKLKWPLSVLSCALLLNACTPKPPDVPACEFLEQRLSTDPVSGHLILTPSPTCEKQVGEPECGHCVYIVSGREVFIGEGADHRLNGKPWSALRAEAIYLPAVESYAPLTTYIINACKKMDCDSQVTRFKVKLDSLKGIAPALKGP